MFLIVEKFNEWETLTVSDCIVVVVVVVVPSPVTPVDFIIFS